MNLTKPKTKIASARTLEKLAAYLNEFTGETDRYQILNDDNIPVVWDNRLQVHQIQKWTITPKGNGFILYRFNY